MLSAGGREMMAGRVLLPVFFLVVLGSAFGQEPSGSAVPGTGNPFGQSLPPMYRGVETRIPGIYVTPVPNAPFTADVQIVSQEQLPDGSTRIRKMVNHIARQSSGRIYNERRLLVPPTYQAEPRLLSAHIYDPNTRLSTYLNPMTHIAQDIVLKRPPVAPQNSVPPKSPQKDSLLKEEELGEQPLGSVTLRGIRLSRTVPAAVSGTGKDVVIVDEYWYSADLSIYMIIKHKDPRTGEQIVAVSDVARHEPNAMQFDVPANYKRVDETPVD
ncbi:hypothetical protein SAMN05421771_4052 [Granulicella pectinivorans]|uniref:Uncharacterized protein n=2 Tax=Granulicella pectinivorans TaxID=474950 RepID=A0A1I6MZL3_9BACT|nr:hypothetical protein SAMN05421771_4052 [Granulicella pectinivorans]